MHCEDPGCLKACPAPGAIVQYSNGIVDFDHEKCIGCGYCIKGMPVRHPAHLPGRSQSLQVHALLGPRCCRPRPGLRQVLSDACHRVRYQRRNEGARRRTYQRSQVARLQECRSLRSPRRRRHPRYVCAATRRQTWKFMRACQKTRRISPIVEIWKGLTNMPASRRWAPSPRSAFCIMWFPAPTRSNPRMRKTRSALLGSR